MGEFIVTLCVAALVGSLFPARWGLRFAMLMALPVPFLVFQPKDYDGGVGETFGNVIIFGALIWLGALGAGVLLRAMFEGWRYGAVGAAGRDDGALWLITQVILGLYGVWCAVPIFAKFSWHLAGIGWSISAHGVVGGVALVVAGALWLWGRGPLRSLALGAALGLAALVADSVLLYPERVLADAALRAGTQQRCMVMGATLQPPQSRDELMAMTMAKARTGPSALLLRVGEGERVWGYRWSFKGIGFTRTPEPWPKTLCTPHRDPLLAVN